MTYPTSIRRHVLSIRAREGLSFEEISARFCVRIASLKAAIADAGHTLEYLPAYSPELNDIGHKWAETKSYRRKTGLSADEIFENQNGNQN